MSSRRRLLHKSNDDFFYYQDKKKSSRANIKVVKAIVEENVNIEDDDETSTEPGVPTEFLDGDDSDESMVDVDSDNSDEFKITMDNEAMTPSKKRGRPPGKQKTKTPEPAGISSDEEKWLDAIEEGRLEEDKTLQRMRDPKAMTARQKARVEKPETFQEFSMEPTSLKPALSAEQVEQKAAKARERKKIADVKKEEEKRKTIQKLLLKRDDKGEPKKKSGRPGRPKIYTDGDRPWVASFSLHLTPAGNFLSSPPGLDFPIERQIEKQPPPLEYCGALGCQNRKKYSCSKTRVPLCSLECYRENMKAVLQGDVAIT